MRRTAAPRRYHEIAASDCVAISSSSSVGTTSTRTLEPARRCRPPTPGRGWPRWYRIHLDTQATESLAHRRAHGRVVLADPGGEHDGVGAAELDEIGAQVVADAWA